MTLPETWATRDLPILREALLALDMGEEADLEAIRTRLGMTATEIRIGVEALANANPPYLEWTIGNGWNGERSPGSIDRVFERARRELGTWPTPDSFVTELATALRQAADAEPEPEKKNKLQATADALLSFGRDVAVLVAAKYVPS